MLAAMTASQLAWLALIVMTGARPPGARLFGVAVACASVAAVAWGAPRSSMARLVGFGRWLAAADRRTGVVFALVVLLAGTLYTGHRNRSFSDEIVVMSVARAVVADGVGAFFARYHAIPWVGDRHPPLMALYYGTVASLFGPDLVVLRMANVLIAALTALLAWHLGRRLFGRTTSALAVPLFICMPYFLRLGAVAMFDLALAAWFLLALILVLRLERRVTPVNGLLLGLALGAGLLTKYHMLLAWPAIGAWVLVRRPGHRMIAQLALATTIAASVLVAWLVVLGHLGAIEGQTAAVGRLVAMVASGHARRMLAEMLVTRLPSAIGVFMVPLFAAGVSLLARRRTRDDRTALWCIAAVSTSLLVSLPDSRYFLPVFPLLAMAGGAWIEEQTADARARLLLTCVVNATATLVLYWDWQRLETLFRQ
jgi:4-amino-4-deoxy-L-arabinose transferase-like glycosyltransferase